MFSLNSSLKYTFILMFKSFERPWRYQTTVFNMCFSSDLQCSQLVVSLNGKQTNKNNNSMAVNAKRHELISLRLIKLPGYLDKIGMYLL